MYNRYLTETTADAQPLYDTQSLHTDPPGAAQTAGPSAAEPPHHNPHTPPQSASVFSNLSQALGGRLSNLKLDMDTVLVLVIVWFILSDGDDPDWELLITIGVLLVLGV